MEYKTPIVMSTFILQKFPGKGGWTYAEMPSNIRPPHKVPFGWMKVKGSIDNYSFKNYKLMPTGNGKLFLPVKLDIRKKIDKQAGDTVEVILYNDKLPLKIPEELILCFENEPKRGFENFCLLTEGEQKTYLDWIYDAKKEETKVNRIIKMMDLVMENKRLKDR